MEHVPRDLLDLRVEVSFPGVRLLGIQFRVLGGIVQIFYKQVQTHHELARVGVLLLGHVLHA